MTHLQSFQKKLFVDQAEAALISSELNQRYLCDFHFSDGYLLVLPQKAYLVTDFRYREAAEAVVDAKEFTVTVAEGGMMAKIDELLRREGAKRVYLEEATMSFGERERWSRKLEGRMLCGGASAALTALREIKTPDELERIAAAQRITDAAFSHFLQVYRRDMTEIEVALELEYQMRRMGAEGVAFDTIAVSGASSSLPHGVPQNRPLQDGFLTMDFGAKLNGYCSDMTRTVVIGKADAEMKRLYQTVLSAQKAALDYLAEGVSCRAADGVARKRIEDAGYIGCFGHSLGHGVGLFIHEAPRLSGGAAEDATLRRGHVVTVEPGIYITGRYGCRIEDMVAIDHSGKLRNFTQSPKELLEL